MLFRRNIKAILFGFLVFSVYAGLINLHFFGEFFSWFFLAKPSIAFVIALILFFISVFLQLQSGKIKMTFTLGYALPIYLMITFICFSSYYELAYGKFGPLQQSYGEVVNIQILNKIINPDQNMQCLTILPAMSLVVDSDRYRCSWIESLRANPRDNFLVLMLYLTSYLVSLLFALIPARIVSWLRKFLSTVDSF